MRMSFHTFLASLSPRQLFRFAEQAALDREKAELRLAAECGRAGPNGWRYDRETGTWRSLERRIVLSRCTTGPGWTATVNGRSLGTLGEVHALDLMLRLDAEAVEPSAPARAEQEIDA